MDRSAIVLLSYMWAHLLYTRQKVSIFSGLFLIYLVIHCKRLKTVVFRFFYLVHNIRRVCLWQWINLEKEFFLLVTRCSSNLFNLLFPDIHSGSAVVITRGMEKALLTMKADGTYVWVCTIVYRVGKLFGCIHGLMTSVTRVCSFLYNSFLYICLQINSVHQSAWNTDMLPDFLPYATKYNGMPLNIRREKGTECK